MDDKLAVVNSGLNTVVSKLEELKDQLPNMDTVDVVDLFNSFNSVQKLLKDTETTIREVIQSRKDSAGVDNSGNMLFSGKSSKGLKIVRRVSMSIKPDAREILDASSPGLYEKLEAQLPHTFSKEKVVKILEFYDIPEEEYSDKNLTTAALEALVKDGHIEPEVAMSIVDVKEIWAYTPIKEKTSVSKKTEIKDR